MRTNIPQKNGERTAFFQTVSKRVPKVPLLSFQIAVAILSRGQEIAADDGAMALTGSREHLPVRYEPWTTLENGLSKISGPGTSRPVRSTFSRRTNRCVRGGSFVHTPGRKPGSNGSKRWQPSWKQWTDENERTRSVTINA